MEFDTAAKLRAFASKAGLAPEALLELAARKGVLPGEAHGEKRKGGQDLGQVPGSPPTKRTLTALEEQIAREAHGRGRSDDSMQTLTPPAPRRSMEAIASGSSSLGGSSDPGTMPGACGKAVAKRWLTRGLCSCRHVSFF